MTDLIPMGALGTPEPARAQFGALSLGENAALMLIAVATRPGTPAPHPLGLRLPGPGLWSQGQGAAAFWTGPGQWMIETDVPDHAERLRDAIRSAPGARLTDQSDGWVCVEVTSDAGAAPIRALLERLVNLAPDQIAPGHATRTLLHHLGCVLIRRAEDRLAVLAPRSSAASLWHALCETAERQAGACDAA
ncbi:sarcosine oxidase subunit gamma [Pseudooceanicola sp. 200-1SW]|uniref:sarcosine oxidase subunit gamma n=1 Tax=Pseudooceanicola sp. 200-1SW TaxID=3425949 RepID=UPI003D7F4BFE